MNILLDKLIPLAVYPLGLAILLLLAGITLVLIGRRFASVIILASALSILWLFSTPIVSRVLLSTLEQTNSQYDGSSADVAILLGGIVRGQNDFGEPDLNDAVDRAFKAVRLYRDRSVKLILVTGGTGSTPEAQLLGRILEDWGVPKDAILIENRSRNTYENAVNSKVLWDAHRLRSGLLITSASHMPRALAVFQKAGFDVYPVATDFRAHRMGGILAVLPDAQALENSTVAIKEWIGFEVYRLRGWT